MVLYLTADPGLHAHCGHRARSVHSRLYFASSIATTQKKGTNVFADPRTTSTADLISSVRSLSTAGSSVRNNFTSNQFAERVLVVETF